MKYLNKKYFIWILVVLSAIIYYVYLLIFPNPKHELIKYLNPLSTVVLGDSFFCFLFIKWIWKWDILQGWLVPFPNLNGTWKGYIKSTWIDPITNKRPDPIPTILTIKQSFVSISCVMRTQEMESYSFSSEFVIDKENQILKLVYSYDSIPKQIVKDRSPQHFGTMSCNIIYDNEKIELLGDYWTGRKTTGTVNLEFFKKEKLNKFPDDFEEHPVSKLRNDE